MKRVTMPIVLLGSLAVSLLAGCGGNGGGSGSGAGGGDPEAVVMQFWNAIGDGDAEAACALVTSDFEIGPGPLGNGAECVEIMSERSETRGEEFADAVILETGTNEEGGPRVQGQLATEAGDLRATYDVVESDGGLKIAKEQVAEF